MHAASGNVEDGTLPTSGPRPAPWRSPTKQEDRAPTIRFSERIGFGRFGTVYRGSLRGEDVAIKRVLLDHVDVHREIEIMQRLAAAPHPNIVALRHSCLEHDDKGTQTYSIAMELFPMNLRELIFTWAEERRSTEWETKLYAYQATRALAHLDRYVLCRSWR